MEKNVCITLVIYQERLWNYIKYKLLVKAYMNSWILLQKHALYSTIIPTSQWTKKMETLHSENTWNGNWKHQNQNWILKLHYKNIPFS